MSRPLSREQRLLRYYRDCVAAEGRHDLTSSPTNPAIALLTGGAEPVVTRPSGVHPLSSGLMPAERWIRTQMTSSDRPAISVGYPLVVGRARRIKGDGHVAALIVRECEVRLDAAGALQFMTDHQPLEMNPSALALAGLEETARLACMEAFASATEPSFAQVIELLVQAGVPLGRLNPDALAPLPEEPGVANTAMLLTTGRATATRAVLADLTALTHASPGYLRRGPLGILLGAAPAPVPPLARPVPAVLPTNLSQDRAVTSALVSAFTVVTGPPGTGKSQVLVNTIAASLAQGQTVLFASRTNRAVDVVFQRLETLPHRGLPLRVGRAALRGPAADCIRGVLARPPSSGVSPGERRGSASWRAVLVRLAPIYAEAGYRNDVQQRLLTARRAADRVAAKWAWNLPPIDRPGTTETVAFALRATRHALIRSGLLRRRRLRSSLQRLDATLPMPGLDTWRDRGELIERLDAIGAAIDASRGYATAAALTAELDRIPSAQAIEDRVCAFSAERLAAGNRLWRTGWDSRLEWPGRAARAGAALVADVLGGDGRGRPSPAALHGCLELFPVWGVTNLAAGSCLPLEPDLFDLVVVDEASQCDVASALPLLARARRAMIIGDRYQLPHVSTLSSDRERSIAQRHAVGGDGLEEMSQRSRSLFDVASARVGEAPLLLDQHYRCHPEIIGFSNHRFYGGRLNVLTPHRAGGGIYWDDVAGTFARGPGGRGVRNAVEASSVIDRLVTEVGGNIPGSSFGVVTAFRAQAELLRELAMDRLGADMEMITIDTVHRFQGDERDVIVLSPTVSTDMPPFFVRVAGHSNLLNVAITRARRRLVVVGDRNACLLAGGALAELADYAAGCERARRTDP